MDIKTSAITITFGDQAENHAKMQCIGKMAPSGFTIEELGAAAAAFEAAHYKCELVYLNEALPEDTEGVPAAVLIIRNGLKAFCVPDALFTEQAALDVDKKAKMYGRVVNKHARHNLCFAPASQEPNYEEGRGRIIAFKDVPKTNAIRENLSTFLGKKGKGLMAEGNYYYDAETCGIGWHGDSERKIVVAVRLGVGVGIFEF